MSKELAGGSAFPHLTATQEGREEAVHFGDPGMTLRDWFAGLAMQGMIANPNDNNRKTELVMHAFQYADHMLAERDK